MSFQGQGLDGVTSVTASCPSGTQQFVLPSSLGFLFLAPEDPRSLCSLRLQRVITLYPSVPFHFPYSQDVYLLPTAPQRCIHNYKCPYAWFTSTVHINHHSPGKHNLLPLPPTSSDYDCFPQVYIQLMGI